jgi:hypothetical protein
VHRLLCFKGVKCKLKSNYNHKLTAFHFRSEGTKSRGIIMSFTGNQKIVSQNSQIDISKEEVVRCRTGKSQQI